MIDFTVRILNFEDQRIISEAKGANNRFSVTVSLTWHKYFIFLKHDSAVYVGVIERGNFGHYRGQVNSDTCPHSTQVIIDHRGGYALQSRGIRSTSNPTHTHAHDPNADPNLCPSINLTSNALLTNNLNTNKHLLRSSHNIRQHDFLRRAFVLGRTLVYREYALRKQ